MTGQQLRAIPLPEVPNDTPMTYVSGGRQFVVVAYGTGDDAGLIGLTLY